MSAARPWLRSPRRRAAGAGPAGGVNPPPPPPPFFFGGKGGGGGGARGAPPPPPRRHLFVGVEGEGGEVAAGAAPPALGVDRAERLAGVLEDAEAVGGGERLQLRHRRRVAEDVDRQEAGGALAERRRGGRRVEVERLRVDVAEDRPGALVEQAVGRGDEAERAGQHLVALAPAERPHAEVQRRRAAGDRDRVGGAEPGGELALEARAHRPQREPPGAQHLDYELLLAGADRGPGERYLLGLEAHWKACSSESTSASQEASMMFSETPIVPHSLSPSVESSRTRVTAPVPWASSRMRTL